MGPRFATVTSRAMASDHVYVRFGGTSRRRPCGHRGTERSRKGYDADPKLCNATPRRWVQTAPRFVTRSPVHDSGHTGHQAQRRHQAGLGQAADRRRLVRVEFHRLGRGGLSRSSTVITQSPHAWSRATQVSQSISIEHLLLASGRKCRHVRTLGTALRQFLPRDAAVELSRAGRAGRPTAPTTLRRGAVSATTCRSLVTTTHRPPGRLGGDQPADQVVGDLVGRAEQHPHAARRAAAAPAAGLRRRTRP